MEVNKPKIMLDFDKYMIEIKGTISLSNCSSQEYREMERRLQEVEEIWNSKKRAIFGTKEGEEND